jgi:hypothetical protein
MNDDLSNIINGFNNISINNCMEDGDDSCMENNNNVKENMNVVKDNMDEDTMNKKKNVLYEKFISLEVANFYCKEYFDDEDFIYMTFELPYDLLDEIIHSANSSIIDYFYSFMIHNVNIENDNDYERLFLNLYNNCINIYDVILSHLMPSWYCDDSPHDPDDYCKFDKEWTNICRQFLQNINYVLLNEINDSTLEYLSNYNQEVYIGMCIIVKKLEDIFNYFNDKEQLNDFYDNDKDYRHISVRIINNLCVILLYLRFYYLNEKGEPNIETEPSIDTMITMEE